MNSQSPLLGFNNNVRHRGRVFHIQTEDSGLRHPHVITHLFADGGRILKTLKTSYAQLVGSDRLPQLVRELMKDQHKAMFIALRDGEFDHLFPAESVPTGASSPGRPAAAGETPAVAGAKLATASGAPVRAVSAAAPTPPTAAVLPATVVAGSDASKAGAEAQARMADALASPAGVSAAPSPVIVAVKPALASAAPTGTPAIGAAALATAAAPVMPAAAASVATPTAPVASAGSARVPAASAVSAGVQAAAVPAVPGSTAAVTSGISTTSAEASAPPMVALPSAPEPAIAISTVPGPTPTSSAQPDASSPRGAASFRGRREAPDPFAPPPPGVALDLRVLERGQEQAKREAPVVENEAGGVRERGSSVRYVASRPAAVFANAAPESGGSIFGEDLINEKSLDEVILSYLSEDLDSSATKK